MTVVVIQQEQETVQIPEWVTDLSSFRRWATSDEFPERGWYAHLDGQLWVDPSMERLGHNQIKTKIGAVLSMLADQAPGSRFLGDRMLLTNLVAGISTEPDGMFLSATTLRAQRARLRQGDDSLEVVGTPDMVLEVVSPSSVKKDTVILRNLYWRAGVREYWLAEPGREDVSFDILRRGAVGYLTVRKHARWVKSSLFNRSFRLTRTHGDDAGPAYTFSVR
ncbi:MAG: Uma2 family endonuclease [Deltaproteobacteria bacterium]|nr:Uma2 family endonuclease [Deltaproteobacteria bacterium]